MIRSECVARMVLSSSHSKAAAWGELKSSNMLITLSGAAALDKSNRYTCRDVGALDGVVDGLVEGALEGLELEEGAIEGFSEGRAEGRSDGCGDGASEDATLDWVVSLAV